MEAIERLRHERRTGPAVAHILGLAVSTVGLVLRRLGLNRLDRLDPKPAIIWFGRLGTSVERVMTDNGSAYRSKLFARALQQAGIRHVRTRPYTPRTNGKAERFIQTSLREWAYARTDLSSAHRNHAIGPWTDAYNTTRPHAGIGGITPLQRLNNLLGNDT